MALYATSSPCDLGSIIELYPEEEPWCAGFAPSKGRRCQCQTNAANRREACSLLRKGTRELERGHDIAGLLDQLAPLVLCKRWHQSQWSDLSNRWIRKVEAFQKRQAQASSRRTTPIRSTRLSYSPSTLEDSESYYAARQRSPASDLLDEQFCAIMQILDTRLGQMERRLEILDDTSSDISRRTENVARALSERITQRESSPTVTTSTTASSRSSRSTRASSTATRSTSPTLAGNNASTTTRHLTSNTTQEALRRITDSTETRSASSSPRRRAPSRTTESRSNTSNTTPATTPSVAARSSTRRVSRVRLPRINTNEVTSTRPTATQRPIEGECAICTNPLICSSHEDDDHNHSSSEDEQDEITWCKAQCGNNYHKECIDQWLSTCRNMLRDPTCPYCRTQWVE